MQQADLLQALKAILTPQQLMQAAMNPAKFMMSCIREIPLPGDQEKQSVLVQVNDLTFKQGVPMKAGFIELNGNRALIVGFLLPAEESNASPAPDAAFAKSA